MASSNLDTATSLAMHTWLEGWHVPCQLWTSLSSSIQKRADSTFLWVSCAALSVTRHEQLFEKDLVGRLPPSGTKQEKPKYTSTPMPGARYANFFITTILVLDVCALTAHVRNWVCSHTPIQQVGVFADGDRVVKVRNTKDEHFKTLARDWETARKEQDGCLRRVTDGGG